MNAEVDMTRRLLDTIAHRLQDAVFGKDVPNWGSKTGLASAVAALSVEDTASKAVRAVAQLCGQWLDKAGALKTTEPLRGDVFGEIRKVLRPAEKKEEKLERLLAAADDRLFNRFNFLSGTTPPPVDEGAPSLDATTRSMTVDLVKLADSGDKVAEFIELKDEDNTSDSPLSALFEVLMYYHLYAALKRTYGESLPDLAQQFDLVVLAPTEYYGHWEFDPQDGSTQDALRRIENALHKASTRLPNTRVHLAFRELKLNKDMVSIAAICLKMVREAIPED